MRLPCDPPAFPEHQGYIGKYGILFKEYREGRTGFIAIELTMNLAAGVLAGLVDEQSECSTLSGVAAVVYGVYAGTTVLLYPYLRIEDKIYFPFVAVAQFVPLVITATGTESTTAKAVATGIPIMLNWVLMARSVYEGLMFGRSIYKFYNRVKDNVKATGDSGNGGMDNPLLELQEDDDKDNGDELDSLFGDDLLGPSLGLAPKGSMVNPLAVSPTISARESEGGTEREYEATNTEVTTELGTELGTGSTATSESKKKALIKNKWVAGF